MQNECKCVSHCFYKTQLSSDCSCDCPKDQLYYNYWDKDYIWVTKKHNWGKRCDHCLPKKISTKKYNFTCKYCNDMVCGSGKKMTVAEWNRCPWQKADWVSGLSIFARMTGTRYIFHFLLKYYAKRVSKK